MTAPADITLYDDNADLSSVVFNPRSASAKESVFVAPVGNIAAGDKKVILGLDAATSKRKTTHISERIEFPLERSVGDPAWGNYEVKDVARIEVRAILPNSMTPAERTEFKNLFRSLQQHATLAKYFDSLEPVM